MNQEFIQLNSSIQSVKLSLDRLKSDTDQISSLLDKNVADFENWLKNSVDLENANLNYINYIITADKKLLQSNMKAIKKYDISRMKNLDDSIRLHEKIAAKEHEKIGRIANLIRHEIANRKILVDRIVEHFRNSPLKKPLNDIKLELSETEKMKEISKEINLHKAFKHLKM